MNYTIVFAGAGMVFPTIGWVFYGKSNYIVNGYEVPDVVLQEHVVEETDRHSDKVEDSKVDI
jgi:hypothetical protein